MIAPLIKPIRLQGGTFYTFSSASEDLGLSLNNSQKKFKFSTFGLLNIPDIKSSPLGENNIGLSNTPGAYSVIDQSKTLNDNFAESLQNYCLNLESMITSDPDYDPTLSRTVSERVFYKWLKELGAIRFREANASEISSNIFGLRWVEEDESPVYKRVVRYVGDINIINSVRNNFNAFTEVYIYVPTSHGNTPTVLFNSINDANYAPNKVFTNSQLNSLANEYINGRDAASVQPAGLSTLAFFDSDTFTYTTPDPTQPGTVTGEFYYYSPVTNSYIQEGFPGFQWWFPNPIANTYFLEPAAFGDSGNDKFKIESVNKIVEYTRSRLDGISLEFKTDVYSGIKGAITDFGTFNESANAQSFDFNAVLIYYDLYDPLNPSDSTTNLFGVLFLDNVDPLASGGGYIPRLTKYKPNSLTGDNGNSYAYRVNLKFDLNTQDTSIETNINNYNPFSLQLYMDALNEMNSAVTILMNNNQVVNDLYAEFQNLQNLVLSNATAQQIEARMTALEDSITNNAALYANTANILNLIQRNYEEITNIYNNQTSVQMSYNLDLIQPGQGIFLDKSNAGSVQIVNTNQQFNLGTKPLISVLNDFTTNPSSFAYVKPLIDFTNYLKITDGSSNNPLIVDRDVVLYVDDTNKSWQKGQVLRISFVNGIDLNNTNGKFNFIVYSDATDYLNTGFPYSAEIGFITYLDFENKGNSPIIELVCIDPATFTFAVDIF